MNKIKLIFIGTGDIAVPLLKSLASNPNFEVGLVVTGVDKPVGRKMSLQPNEIKKVALELNLPLYQPENIKSEESVEALKALHPDYLLVMAYGQLLSQEVLDLPKKDCLNVHASLLPKYRGASPIQSAILNGDQKTGASLMKMVKKMDAGAVYEQFELPIDKADTSASLEEKMATLAADHIPKAIVRINEENIQALPQPEDAVTHVSKISKADGQINWNDSAEMIERKIRAFNPWPSSYSFFKGKRLKIHQGKVLEGTAECAPGKVYSQGQGVAVATGDGMLELLHVQMEGKSDQTIREFLNGNQDFIGSFLTSNL